MGEAYGDEMKRNNQRTSTEYGADETVYLDTVFRQHLHDELTTVQPRRVKVPVVSAQPNMRYNKQPIHAVCQIQIAGFRMLTFMLQSASTAGRTIPG